MAILPGNPGDLVTWEVGELAMKSCEFGSGAKPGGVGGGGTPQSTVVSTRGTPAAEHPARRGSDPVIADDGDRVTGTLTYEEMVRVPLTVVTERFK